MDSFLFARSTGRGATEAYTGRVRNHRAVPSASVATGLRGSRAFD